VNGPRPERLIGIVLVLALAAAAVLVVALLSGPAPSAPATSPVEGVPATVERVTDGDTIVVIVDGRRERVRYIGLDAPEVANAEEGTPAECGGDEARSANARLVVGNEVVLERDDSERDRFGRLLRHVWLEANDGWRLVGERLVEDGMVEARSYPPDTAHDGQLDRAERRARDAGLGIWGSC
jgi:micrococcal nuclease